MASNLARQSAGPRPLKPSLQRMLNLTLADDYGRLHGDTKRIAGNVFWGRPRPGTPVSLEQEHHQRLAPAVHLSDVEYDQIAAILGPERAAALRAAAARPTVESCEELLLELEAQKMVVRYRVRGEVFLMIVNWDKHQRISHKGRDLLPHPPAIEAPRGASDEARADAGRAGGGPAAGAAGGRARSPGDASPPGQADLGDRSSTGRAAAPRERGNSAFGEAVSPDAAHVRPQGAGSSPAGPPSSPRPVASASSPGRVPARESVSGGGAGEGPGSAARARPSPAKVTVETPDEVAALAWRSIADESGPRLALGQAYRSPTQLAPSLHRRWVRAWTEAAEKHTLAHAAQLGRWIRAGGWAHLDVVSPEFVTAHLHDALSLSGAWDGLAPAERRGRAAAVPAEPARPAGPADRVEDGREPCPTGYCDKQFHYDREPDRPGSAQARPCPLRTLNDGPASIAELAAATKAGHAPLTETTVKHYLDELHHMRLVQHLEDHRWRCTRCQESTRRAPAAAAESVLRQAGEIAALRHLLSVTTQERDQALSKVDELARVLARG